VYASDKKQAEKYISIRNIGERIVGEMVDKTFKACPLPSNLYKTRKLIPCIHCLTFYGWIAGKFLDMHDHLLRDDGVLHDIMHEMEHPKELGFRMNVFDRLEDLERMIPGLKTFNPTLFDVITI
jgi:hypothetical protein